MTGLLIIDIDSREAESLLERMEASLGDGFLPEMKQIDAHLAQSVDLNFKQRGRPNRWAALSPVTIEARERRVRAGGRRPVADMDTELRDSDELRLSVTSPAGSGAKNQVSEVTPFFIKRGTTKVQARRLQEGWSGKPRTPARRFLVIQDSDETFAVETLGRGIARKAAAAARR